MNLVESYLVKVISEEPYKEDMVKVKAIWDCYGNEYEDVDIYSKSHWEELKKKGYKLS